MAKKGYGNNANIKFSLPKQLTCYMQICSHGFDYNFHCTSVQPGLICVSMSIWLRVTVLLSYFIQKDWLKSTIFCPKTSSRFLDKVSIFSFCASVLQEIVLFSPNDIEQKEVPHKNMIVMEKSAPLCKRYLRNRFDLGDVFQWTNALQEPNSNESECKITTATTELAANKNCFINFVRNNPT